MPALAQMKPCFVSVIRTRSSRRISRLSERTSSTSAASLPSFFPSSIACSDGSTSASRRTIPSAFETTFCEITTMSPSSKSARSAISSPSFAPSPTSGSPSTGMTRISPIRLFLFRAQHR